MIDIQVRPGHMIFVDLDRTLAEYCEGDWQKYGPTIIGPPIKKMVDQVKTWLGQGIDVWIFTARVHHYGVTKTELAMITSKIEAWCLEHIGRVLPVTCSKHPKMDWLFDDRAVHVVPNSGVFMLPDGVEYAA